MLESLRSTDQCLCLGDIRCHFCKHFTCGATNALTFGQDCFFSSKLGLLVNWSTLTIEVCCHLCKHVKSGSLAVVYTGIFGSFRCYSNFLVVFWSVLTFLVLVVLRTSVFTFANMSKVAPWEAANALISESLPENKNISV